MMTKLYVLIADSSEGTMVVLRTSRSETVVGAFGGMSNVQGNDMGGMSKRCK